MRDLYSFQLKCVGTYKQLKYMQGCGENYFFLSFLFNILHITIFSSKASNFKISVSFCAWYYFFQQSGISLHFASFWKVFEQKIDFVFFSNILFSLAIQLASRSRGVRHSVGWKPQSLFGTVRNAPRLLLCSRCKLGFYIFVQLREPFTPFVAVFPDIYSFAAAWSICPFANSFFHLQIIFTLK